MTWFSGVLIFLIAWWMALFTVLPWGNHPDEEPLPGNAPSAPANARIGLKFLITTAIAAGAWIIIYILMAAELIDFHQIARGMMDEDMAR